MKCFALGMDFAHVFNGYRYHTKYDHIDYLPPQVLQRTGDNILALVRRMANSDELINPDVNKNIVSVLCSFQASSKDDSLCDENAYLEYLLTKKIKKSTVITHF